MPFCSQSRPLLDFSIWSYSCLGCADLCKVTFLYLWILCSILSVPQGTICGLLASNSSLPLFGLLIFSTSSVGRLWVCSCLGAFSFSGSFWVNMVFPLVIHSGTCSPCMYLFLSRTSLSWMVVNFLNQNPCIPSWPGVFQFDIFLVSFWVNRRVFPLSGIFRALLILLSNSLSIRLFRCVFLVAIF